MKYITALVFVIFCFAFGFSQNISSEPDWAPDGKSFVYTYGKEKTNLFIYSVVDSSNVQITFSKSIDASPAWSPDGKYIAYVSYQNGNRDLYYYNIKNKKTVQLTESLDIEATPSWWSDNQIVFVRFNSKDKSRKIFKIDLLGNETEFVPDPALQAIYPCISPDKEVLVFAAKPVSGKGLFHLYSKSITTGKVRQLENQPMVSYNPSWFPNGNKVAFINQSSQDINSAGIYTYNFKKEKLSKILVCEKGCYHPRVSPNGEQILYLEGWGKDNKGIFILNLKTNKTSKVK